MKAILLKEFNLSPLAKEVSDEQRLEALKITKNNLQAISSALLGVQGDAYNGEVNESVINKICIARDNIADAINYLHEIVDKHHDPECE